MTVSVPASGPVVPTACLLRALKPVVAERLRTTVVGIDRRPWVQTDSLRFEDIGVVLGDGRRMQLLFKDLSPRKTPARLRSGYHPLREIQVYGKMLEHAGLGTPRFLGACVDKAIDRYWLFIESISGIQLQQINDPETWEEAASWLATLHNRLAADVSTNRTLLASPTVYDADFYRMWMSRAAECTTTAMRSGLRRIRSAHDTMIDCLTAQPPTLIHGDLSTSKLMVCRRPGRMRIFAVDWERASIAPGAMDLATLTIGCDQDTAERLVRSYAQAAGADSPVALQELRKTHDLCRLHLYVQRLGWTDHWNLPAEQPQIWLRDALRIVEEHAI